jgi:hypothetical protein
VGDGVSDAADRTSTGDTDTDDIAARVQRDWQTSTLHLSDWRTEARTCYDFVAGRQYTDEEIASLQQQQRPPVVFNRIGAIINAISGYEINGRQEISYVPREASDNPKAHVENAAAKWFREQAGAEDEESQAFRDALTCGYGWTNTRLDYEIDPQGMPVTERCDPLSMRYDRQAKRRNLIDSRWVAHGKWMDLADAEELIPDVTMASGEGGDPADGGQSPGSDFNEERYPATKNGADPMQRKGQVFVIEYQWWEHEAIARMANPFTGAIETVRKDIADKIAARFADANVPAPEMVPGRRRVYKRVFVCGMSASGISPAPCPERFTYQPVTGTYDRNKNTFYGIVRGMIDPQAWANKWLSQTMHNMNSAVKSGWFFEDGVFENPGRAEQAIAKPGFMQPVAQGAISGSRMMRADPQPIQPATMQLAEFAITAIRDVPGVNVEMLGLADRAQAGVLESQRKAAGMSILAPLFDALRQHRKNVGHVLLYYIRHYLSDGRLIRIVGDEGAKYVPLVRQEGVEQYDIVVDDAPSSPNQKEAVFGALMPVLPMVAKAGKPIPPEVWDYIPGIPSPLAEKFKESMKPDPNAPPPPEVIQAQQAQADLQQKGQELQFKQQEAIGKSQLEAAKMQADIEIEKARMALELEKLQLERERMTLGREKLAVGFMSEERGRAAEQQTRTEDAARAEMDRARERDASTSDAQRGDAMISHVVDGLAQFGSDLRAGLQEQARATAAMAEAAMQSAMAETELVRDPQTGRAIGARKRPPRQPAMGA